MTTAVVFLELHKAALQPALIAVPLTALEIVTNVLHQGNLNKIKRICKTLFDATKLFLILIFFQNALCDTHPDFEGRL